MGGLCIAASEFYKTRHNIILSAGIFFVSAGKRGLRDENEGGGAASLQCREGQRTKPTAREEVLSAFGGQENSWMLEIWEEGQRKRRQGTVLFADHLWRPKGFEMKE